MYFTENRYDRSIEWMMKGVPNFYPRGSGIVVTGKFEYTAKILYLSILFNFNLMFSKFCMSAKEPKGSQL